MKFHRTALSAAVGASLLALASCQDAASPEAAAPVQRPPASVGVVEIQPESIPVTSELPGRIAPTRIAEVRPRVGGIVVERVFEQGSDVNEGDPLFRIDPLTFEVEVESAEAGVARAEAALTQARQEAQRTQALVSRNTIGTANLDTAIATQRQAEAEVAAARATLRAAQINLDYATVRAPISGRIGRALITEGALVSTTGTEALATIQQLDPVYADIQQPVSQLLRLREALRSGALTQLEPDVAQVRLKLDDGSEYPQPGRLLFSEATVEETSGQVTLRAEFPNPDDTLLPGLYVRVAVEQGVDRQALAVPNQAIQRDTAGRSQVYIVNDQSAVELRDVEIGRVVGNRSVIAKGLSAGDRVIVDGIQKIGPGATVAPTSWTPVGETAEPASAAAPEAQRTTPAPGSEADATGGTNPASQDAGNARESNGQSPAAGNTP